MSAHADSILAHLRTVDAERRRRSGQPDMTARVQALKTYQQKRFSHSYADLLKTARYGPAARFFLDELYGPHDFSERDAQFARVVPALVRLFPHEIVATVNTLAELHALSEVLDSIAAGHLPDAHVDAARYVSAWQATGRADDREKQIALTLGVGESLDRLTRNPLLRHTLRMMRGPAKAAGLGALQSFLEIGFDTFKAMRGAGDFLATIATRERALARALFESSLQGDGRLGDTALGQLP
ncbi:hypothetical protein [Piscinibacter sp. XHJ-5]|uniref:FFLEELY motif protein n=1 Tax=Piscinibacter sp. XHJ-5 TaxID=3037797 RepID=UPI0024536240|nr:hypothetical protein [Piscinibacter sp. XHJ-5]